MARPTDRLRMPPFLVLSVLAAVAFALLVGVLPLVVVVQGRHNATTMPPTPAQPAPWCTDQAEHFFADNPTDKVQAGPGSDFKESLHAFGPSAVPVNDATMTPAQRFEAVKALFMQRAIASTKNCSRWVTLAWM